MSRPLRVLVVEDSEDDALLMELELRRGGFAPVTRRVDTAAALMAALDAQVWDVVLSDYRMPQLDGMEALKLVQARGGDLPFILISGAIGEDTAVAAMKAGAHDYLLKGQLTRLAPAVERELREAEVRRHHRQAAAELRENEERFRAAFENGAVAMALAAPDHRLAKVNAAFCELLGFSEAQLVGRSILEITHPDDLSASRDSLAVVVGGERVSYRLEKRYLHRDGTVVWGDVSAAAVRDDQGRLLYLVTHIQDITERKRVQQALEQANHSLQVTNEELRAAEEELRTANEELRATNEELQVATDELRIANDMLEMHVQQRTAELQGANALLRRALRGWRSLSECNQALLRATGETELLEQICQVIVDLGGYRMAWVGLTGQDPRRTVRPVAQAGFEEGYLSRVKITWADVPRGRGPTGTAIRTGKPVVCLDILHDPRLAPWRKDAVHRGYVSSAALPLLANGQCLGALTIYASELDAFKSGELALLGELTNNLTYGLVALRTRADRERLQKEILRIVEREQQRIAADLHDSLSQHLAGILLLNSALCDELAQSPRSRSAADAVRINALLKEALSEARDLARGLHPVKAEPDALMVSLGALAERAQRMFKVQCNCQCRPPVLTNDNTMANHLYRIAQEAIHNAVRHGKAKRINIRLAATHDQLQLTIRDNGVGIPRELKRRHGLGLETMRHRAEALGGVFGIARGARRGTVVTCRVPIRPRGRENGPTPKRGKRLARYCSVPETGTIA